MIRNSKWQTILRCIAYFSVLVLIVWGGVSTFSEVRPFWVDEWRIIYNIKFLSYEELWGKLAFMQQFPRAYLSCYKYLASLDKYSYVLLRLPSFVAGFAAIAAMWYATNKIFPYKRYGFLSLLPLLMLVSCGTFTEYFVETKQYSMELFLSVVALLQCHYLLQASVKFSIQYVLLCMSMLIAPFLSYTYPILLVSIIPVLLLRSIFNRDTDRAASTIVIKLFVRWFPVFLGTFSSTIFYIIDAQYAASDPAMREYWGHLLNIDGFNLVDFIWRIFGLLAQPGSGFVFWYIFGLVGVMAVLSSIVSAVKNIKRRQITIEQYGVSVLVVVIVLGLCRQLPIGEPRLTAFAVPALSVLVVASLHKQLEQKRYAMPVAGLASLMLLGLCGNIFTTIAASCTGDKYAKRMTIYRETQKAVESAEQNKIPVLVTSGIAWPYDNTRNFPFEGNVPGDWVLSTWPAYHASQDIPVYDINSVDSVQAYFEMLPDNIEEVCVGDGTHYAIVARDKK